MKVTGFNPSIITQDPESVIALFEELGFERTHNKVEEGDVPFSSVRMKDANGFHVDVVETSAISRPQDITATRINVDDFDEACKIFEEHGFKPAEGFGANDTASSKYGYYVSPNKMVVDICQHIKK